MKKKFYLILGYEDDSPPDEDPDPGSRSKMAIIVNLISIVLTVVSIIFMLKYGLK